MKLKPTEEIDGWFDFADVYDFLISTVPKNGHFLEGGAWKGKSSSYLCDHCKDFNVYIVDTWEGSPEFNLDIRARREKAFDAFLKNMRGRHYNLLKMPSNEAVKKFPDNSLDVVFIDMNHSYESVKEDIKIWYPKVKVNGYLAGHDYNTGAFPGLVWAVHQRLGKENIRVVGQCWIHQKKEEDKNERIS